MYNIFKKKKKNFKIICKKCTKKNSEKFKKFSTEFSTFPRRMCCSVIVADY